MVAVLFVCMGNICRSPMAEGAFRAATEEASLSRNITIDSAGTIGYHAGSAPDLRAQKAAKEKGVDISAQRSRKVRLADFAEFDYILAMDDENFMDLMRACPESHKSKISMFLSHAPHLPIDEMPDPYYGHEHDFDTCFAAAVDAANGLLALIKKEHF